LPSANTTISGGESATRRSIPRAIHGGARQACFSDVLDNGSAGYINRLYELGITGGGAPGLFCTANPTNRDQMAVFLVLAMEEQAAAGTAHNTYFNDLGPPTHPIKPVLSVHQPAPRTQPHHRLR
jgi:hypothetical protein